MLVTWLEFLNYFQPPEGGGGGVDPTGGGGGAGCADPGMLPMLLVMVLVFYFLIMRPQQKRQKQHDTMLKALKPGDTVRTSGGLRGDVVSIDEREVVLLIAPKVKVNFLRSSIGGVVGDEAEKAKDSAAKDAKDSKDAKAKDAKAGKDAGTDGKTESGGDELLANNGRG